MATGWSWDEIENTVTMQRLEALCRYWKKNPPVHKLFAAYVGYKPKDDEHVFNGAELFGMAPGGVLSTNMQG
jgi:hypothetical protein